jgi:radical SAM superfamily enzyme YgiQ (UPF0313 family)
MDLSQVRVRGVMPPLDLLHLAAWLQKHGHETRVLDLYAREVEEEDFPKVAEMWKPDLVGFTTYTANVDVSLRLARASKQALPEVPVVLGGIHASYLPEVCLAEPAVDWVVRGEGEETLRELVEALAAGRSPRGLAGLAWREEPGVVDSGPPRPLLKDLDALPWPDYGQLDFDRYYLAVTREVTGRRVANVLTMRGCPYRCTFCSHHYGYEGGLRKRSPEDVVRQLRHLKERHGVGEVQIEDNSFTCDPKRVLRICELLEAEGLDLVWNCNVRAETASRELFDAMHRAGCRRVLLGVESGSAEMLERMKKGITLEQVRRAVTLARRHGLLVNCAFILGTPGETRESAEATYRFALELDPDFVMFSVLVPVIGSELFDAAVSAGKVRPEAVQGADFVTVYSEKAPLPEMSEVPREELLALMERYTRGFYLRPAYFLRRLRALRSPSELRRLFWGFALVVRHQILRLLPGPAEDDA